MFDLLKFRRLRDFLTSRQTEPPEIVRQVEIAQFVIRAKLSATSALIGMVIAIAIGFEFQSRTQEPGLALDGTILVLLYIVLGLGCRFYSRFRFSAIDGGHFKPLYNTTIFLIGVAWIVFISHLMIHASMIQIGLAFAVIIGLISTSTTSGPIWSSLLFVLPIIIGTFITILLDHRTASAPIVVCFVSYSFLTLSSIFYVNNRLFERHVGAIKLARTNETIRILLHEFEENASDWLWETDAEFRLMRPSARLIEVARQPAAAICGDFFTFMAGDDPMLDLQGQALPEDATIRAGAGDAFLPLRRRMAARKPFRDIIVPVSMGGERRWWLLTGTPVEDHRGAFTGYRGVGSDVTAMHRSRERISYLARHDTLTDLANRAEFNNTLSQLLTSEGGSSAALLCLDLDQFKAVNDSYGHGLGDSVLRAVAHRIRGAIRDCDVAARLGGDEFSVVLPSNNEFEATAVAERVIDRVARPYKFDGVTVEIGVSIGIALAPRDGATPEDLYKNADLALYRAKDSGRGTWRLFDPAMDRHLQDRRSLQRDIKSALRDDQLFVEYQPVIDLASRRIIGLEALVRWNHAERGVIPPGDFIEIAERSGLIGPITAFVLGEATALAVILPDFMTIAVNLSPLHLREAWLVDQLSGIIKAAGVTPSRIEFEVTETAVLETEGRTMDNLRRLRALGCRIAIDDFGTGYSSLATLRRFPFDRLKIDRGFIDELERNDNDAPIVKAIIDLSQTLGLRVTAEGIETERHAEILQAYHCNDGQGFLFSPPVRSAQILELFASGRTITGLLVGCDGV